MEKEQEMNILLSIIVPVYNAGCYLSSMIRSVINQTWKHWELLLIDDGSTDGSGIVCDNFAKKDTRIIVLHQKNAGQAEARNAGLNIAKGNLVSFVDDDDILNPFMYETLINNLHKTNADVSACAFMHATDEQIDHMQFSQVTHTTKTYTSQSLVHGFFKPTWKIPIWNKIYSRCIIGDMRFGNYRLGEDNLFSYNTICRLQSMAFIDEPLYIQRMHGKNFELTGFKYYNELLHVKKIILDDIRQRYPDEYIDAYREYIYECIRTYDLLLDKSDPELLSMASETLLLLRKTINTANLSAFPNGHRALLMMVKFGMIKSGKKIII